MVGGGALLGVALPVCVCSAHPWGRFAPSAPIPFPHMQLTQMCSRIAKLSPRPLSSPSLRIPAYLVSMQSLDVPFGSFKKGGRGDMQEEMCVHICSGNAREPRPELGAPVTRIPAMGYA